MTKADELLRELIAVADAALEGCGDDPRKPAWQSRCEAAWSAARAYLNEKPHEPPPRNCRECGALSGDFHRPNCSRGNASPPHAAAEPERDALQKLSAHEHKQLEFYRKATTAAEPEKPELIEAVRQAAAYKLLYEQSLKERLADMELYASPSAQPIAREPK